MLEEGLEPPRVAPPEPKSGASANSATRARSLPSLGERRDSACGAFRLQKGALGGVFGEAALGGGFAAVFGLFVGVAVAGVAGDDAACAAQAGGVRVGSVALDAADAAIFDVVGEYGFAIVGGVAVAIGGAGHAILEATRAFGICGVGGGAGREFWVFGRTVCRDGHRNAGSAARQTHYKTEHEQQLQ